MWLFENFYSIRRQRRDGRRLRGGRKIPKSETSETIFSRRKRSFGLWNRNCFLNFLFCLSDSATLDELLSKID